LTVSFEVLVKESIALIKDCKENLFLGMVERRFERRKDRRDTSRKD
jgi:hypothetical protein